MVTNIGYHKNMEKDFQAQILKVLKASPSGLQMEDLTEQLVLSRHAIANTWKF
jgi:hypothetical protein